MTMSTWMDHKQYVEYISGSMLQHGHVETTRRMRMPHNEIKSKIVLGSKDCPQCGRVEDWNILNYKALCLWRFESVSSWPSQITRIQSPEKCGWYMIAPCIPSISKHLQTWFSFFYPEKSSSEDFTRAQHIGRPRVAQLAGAKVLESTSLDPSSRQFRFETRWPWWLPLPAFHWLSLHWACGVSLQNHPKLTLSKHSRQGFQFGSLQTLRYIQSSRSKSRFGSNLIKMIKGFE